MMQWQCAVGHRTRNAALGCLASLLVGCGGGGGGGGGESPPPAGAQREVPLLLTASNASDAATLGLGYGSLGLAFGQLAVDWADGLASSGTAALALPCPGGGTGSVRWTDADGNRVVGAGDQLVATLDACHLKVLEDRFGGTLTVTLRSPGAGLQWAGVITIGSGFASAGQPSLRVAGELDFDLAADRLAKVLRVRSGTQPLTLSATNGGQSVTDVVTQLQLRREIRRDTARITHAVAHRLSSDVLGGQVLVSTEVPWTNWYDTFPDAGRLAVSGAGTAVVRLEASAVGSSTFAVRLDAAAIGSVNAPDAATQYLWSGAGWVPQDDSQQNYQTSIAERSTFVELTRPEATSVQPQLGPLVWTYSRPLAPETLAGAVLRRQQSAPGLTWGPSDVPTELKIEGAMLTVTPLQQLEPGDTYEVIFDNQFLTPVVDTSGRSTRRPGYTFTAMQTILAAAVFDGPPLILGKDTGAVVLDASSSQATAPGAVGAQWRQLSGPPLVFSGADNRRVSMQARDAMNGLAVVELEARNSAGDIDRQRFEFPVLGDPSTAFAIGITVGGGPMTVITSVDAGASSSYARYFGFNNVIDVFRSSGGRFLSQPPAGETWRPGLVFGFGSAGAGIMNWLPPGGVMPCGSAARAGTVTVLDVAFDGAGELERLSVEFDESCDGLLTHGSIRFNNSAPLLSR